MNEPIDPRTLKRVRKTAQAVLGCLATLAEAKALEQCEVLSGTALALASLIEATDPPEGRPALRSALVAIINAGADFERVPGHA